MAIPIRVLILEDRVADAELMLHELRQAGFDPAWQHVVIERDYLAAIETNPDLILADWSLPQFTGLRALQLMNERGLDIPFVIVSGSIGEEVAVDALRQGAADYLLKDRLARLGEAVRRALEGKQLREERKQTEAQLVERNATLNALLESAATPVFSLDRDYCYTSFNKAHAAVMKAIYGSDIEIGHNMLGYQRVPEDREVARKNLDRALRGEHFVESAYSGESDSPRRFFEVAHNPIYDISGEIIGLSVFASDITERKQAEEELRMTLEELKRSNTELEQFAYVASHDLQEPLRMVTSYVQLLERRYKGKLDKDADEFIGFAVDGAERMQRLINDLLTFSRVGTRGQPLVPASCEVALDQALDNLRVAIRESKAKITRDPLPEVLADESQLVQLFQNLVGNAVKFHGEKAPRVHVSVDAHGKEWIFSVRDNGIGIESQYAEQIFIIFQRLHDRSEYPGTGIGLAICKKIVLRHGGRIWVESQPGKGATFYFTLPKKELDDHDDKNSQAR